MRTSSLCTSNVRGIKVANQIVIESQNLHVGADLDPLVNGVGVQGSALSDRYETVDITCEA